MKLQNLDVKHASLVGSATLAVLLAGATPSWAVACAAPAPLIGVTGPYGIAAAAIAYGGFLAYKKLKKRG